METATLNQTMLRVKDPVKSVAFYEKWFGMTLIQARHFGDFSLYFMVTLPEGHTAPAPDSPEAAVYVKGGSYGCCLELTHNHGTENDEKFKYHNGNTEPRGFGHIGFMVDDVYNLCTEMSEAGVEFAKKPDSGGIKGLAFATDPDGYWVEMIKRSESAAIKGRPTFHQAMIRVKELESSVSFYRDQCNLTEIDRLEFPEWKFTCVHMASVTEEQKKTLPKPGTDEAHEALWAFSGTTIELTYNHGTEDDPKFVGYDNGNKEPNRGFGHLAMMVDDVYKASEELEAKGVEFQKKPNEGRMKGLAFILDPDGYWVELVSRKTEAQVLEELAAKEQEKTAEKVSEGATDTPTLEHDEKPDRRLTMAVHNSNVEETIKTGYLLKVGGAFKSWKKRFFVLTTSAIAYYTDQTRHQADLKGGVLLEHVKEIAPAEVYDSKKPHVLVVATKDRRYLFQAGGDQERDDWILAIKEAWYKAVPNPTDVDSTVTQENKRLREELAKVKTMVGVKPVPATAKCVAITNYTVTDKEAFDTYLEKVGALANKHGAKALATSENSESVEGDSAWHFTTVEEWPSSEVFHTFYKDANCETLKTDRAACCVCELTLLPSK
eukprot:m.19545 g.19545  ORF g.19545 m.19545 type:complete len:604 (+) comp12505_c0_seq1:132-1943(+)